MKKLLLATAAALALISPLYAQDVAAPVGISAKVVTPGKATLAEALQVTARVSSIDLDTRQVGLQASDGSELTLAASDELKNLDKLKPGDLVTIEYAQSLTLELVKGGGAIRSRVEGIGESTSRTESSAERIIDRKVTGVADVIATNPETQTVTLRGAENTVDLMIESPDQFRLVKVGDQVKATYLQGVALSVTRPEATESAE